MSFDGSGVYSLNFTFTTEANSPPIAISKLDTEFADIATALSTCLLRNGNGKPTADIDWNAKRITNLATATADGDALSRAAGDARYTRSGDNAVVTGTWTFSGALVTGTWSFSGAFPVLQFLDSDLTETTGKRWYIGANADLFFVYRNTSAAGDFATYEAVLAVSRTAVQWMGNSLAVVTSGSFTANLRATPGGAILATANAYWKKVGDVVTLTVRALSTTNTTQVLVIDSLPTEIRSDHGADQHFVVLGQNDGAYALCVVRVETGEDYLTLRLAPFTTFSSSANAKGTDIFTITYRTTAS